MAVPLIVRDEAAERQEVVMLCHDFSLTPPDEPLSRLTGDEATHLSSGMAASMSGTTSMPTTMDGMDQRATRGGMTMSESMPGMDHDTTTGGNMAMSMDMIDAAFDAYLANDSMLVGPEILRVD